MARMPSFPAYLPSGKSHTLKELKVCYGLLLKIGVIWPLLTDYPAGY